MIESFRLRLGKIVILTVLLLGICLYYYTEADERVNRYLGNLSDGDIAHLPYWKVVNKQKGFMNITDNIRFLDIYSSASGIQEGDRISLTAVKRAEALYLQKYHVHTAMRRVKVWISVLPLLAIFALFLGRYRFDRSEFAFRQRRADG